MMTDRPIDADTIDAVRTVPVSSQPGCYDAEPGFDDGLVHDHGWACRERSAPAY